MSVAEFTATAVVVRDISVEPFNVRVDVVVDHDLCSVKSDFFRQAVPNLCSSKHTVTTD
ncbi:hypothetical protein D3C86_1444700 [compost metagenome]